MSWFASHNLTDACPLLPRMAGVSVERNLWIGNPRKCDVYSRVLDTRKLK